MSRRNKAAKARVKQRKKKEAHQRIEQDVVEEITTTYSCSTGVAQDFAEQCDRRLDDVLDEIPFTRAGLVLWEGRPGREQLAAVISDYLAEQQRHAQALSSLLRRFEALSIARTPEAHEHLEPIEDYREKVRQTIFADEPRPEP